MSLKIAAAVLCELMAVGLLRKYRPEFIPLSEIVCCAAIGLLLLGDLQNVIASFSDLLAGAAGTGYLPILLRVLGCTLTVQFSADWARDHGESALAGFLEFAGSVLILSLSLPLFRALLQTLGEAVRQ